MSERYDGNEDLSGEIGNNVQELRESLLLSKAELARKAGVSALTIDRVEKGSHCRMDTKRKILLALGLKLSDRKVVFFEEGEDRESVSGMEETHRTSEEMAQKVVAVLHQSKEKS